MTVVYRIPRARRPALLALGLVLVLVACDPTGPSRDAASFEGTWAGAAWRGDATASLYPTADTLTISGGSPAGAQLHNDWVHVQLAVGGPGTYPLPPGAATFRYLVGGDAIASSYASQTGTLTIDAIGPAEVSGRVEFDAVFAGGGSAPAGGAARFEASFRIPLTALR